MSIKIALSFPSFEIFMLVVAEFPGVIVIQPKYEEVLKNTDRKYHVVAGSVKDQLRELDLIDGDKMVYSDNGEFTNEFIGLHVVDYICYYLHPYDGMVLTGFTFGKIEYSVESTDIYDGFKTVNARYVNKDEKRVLAKYRDLLDDSKVSVKNSRAGPCRSIFADNSFVFDVSETIPAMRFRKMAFRWIFEELKFFLSGETNTKILEDKGIDIWKGNTTREFLDANGFPEYADGEMGPSYGWQFRHAGAAYPNPAGGTDQLMNAIHDLRNNPTSRRIIINLWNAADIAKMPLPPCMFYYQFIVDEDRLSLHVLMRSSDFVLAGNWNVLSATMLLYMVARITGFKPHRIHWNAIDLHLYENLREGLIEMMQHDCKGVFPRLHFTEDAPLTDIMDFEFKHFKIVGYKCDKKVKLDMNA